MTIDIEKIDWEKSGGLVPAVVQDSKSLKVLMLGYMNQEALEKTQASELVTFFSRSKNRLWQKGETSGNTLKLNSIEVDCDNDTILVSAEPQGPTCHTGSVTCFVEQAMDANSNVMAYLEEIIDDRKEADPKSSYVSSLLTKGIKKISQKVGEEGVEVALAGVAETDAEVVSESADLIFHLLVLLKSRGLSIGDVEAELLRRAEKK